MHRCLIHHAIAPIGHRPGDAGRQKGLSQARIAVEEQIARLHSEALGIPAAGLKGTSHNRPGADPQIGVRLVGVIAEAEALEGLPGGAGEEGQLLLLLLTAQLPEALTHLSPHVTAAATDRANRSIFQKALFEVVFDQPFPFPLQVLILLADAGKLRLRIAPLLEDRLGRLGHGEAEGPVNFC